MSIIEQIQNIRKTIEDTLVSKKLFRTVFSQYMEITNLIETPVCIIQTKGIDDIVSANMVASDYNATISFGLLCRFPVSEFKTNKDIFLQIQQALISLVAPMLYNRDSNGESNGVNVLSCSLTGLSGASTVIEGSSDFLQIDAELTINIRGTLA